MTLRNARPSKWYGERRVIRIGIDRQCAARRTRSRRSEDHIECRALSGAERDRQARTRDAESAASRRRARQRNGCPARIGNRHGHGLILSCRYVSKIRAARICAQRARREACARERNAQRRVGRVGDDAQRSTRGASASWSKGRVESDALIGGEGHRQSQSADRETGSARSRLRDRHGGSARVGQSFGLTAVAAHLDTSERQAGRIGSQYSGSNSRAREGKHYVAGYLVVIAVVLVCVGSKRDAAAESSGSGGRERDRRRSRVSGVHSEGQGEVAHGKSCAAQRRLRDGEIGSTAVRKTHSAGLVAPNLGLSKSNRRGTR